MQHIHLSSEFTCPVCRHTEDRLKLGVFEPRLPRGLEAIKVILSCWVCSSVVWQGSLLDFYSLKSDELDHLILSGANMQSAKAVVKLDA